MPAKHTLRDLLVLHKLFIMGHLSQIYKAATWCFVDVCCVFTRWMFRLPLIPVLGVRRYKLLSEFCQAFLDLSIQHTMCLHRQRSYFFLVMLLTVILASYIFYVTNNFKLDFFSPAGLGMM